MTREKTNLALCLLALLVSQSLNAQETPTDHLAGVQRIVFLGDSITYAGHYVNQTEYMLGEKASTIEFLDLGLPSETVSGLSEPGHAGGRFPRPDLAERLDRVLEQTKPDLVIANYGMNCGIYRPYSEERFAAFQNGMNQLHQKVVESGAKIIHLTPPAFDPLPVSDRLAPADAKEFKRGYVGYDEVLHLYSAWLLAKRGQGWHVVDPHAAIVDYMERRRESEPEFTLAKDGVHINEQGHFLIAKTLVNFLDPDNAIETDELEELKSSMDKSAMQRFQLVRQRQRINCDAWLTSIGHLRPGMKKGLDLDEAKTQTDQITEKLEALK